MLANRLTHVKPHVSGSAYTMATDEMAGRLRAARERAGLSQREAARRLGVHFGSLNRYEQGKMRVPADLLSKAEALLPDAPIEPAGPAAIPTVAIPLHVLTYWRGRVEEQVNTIGGVTRSLEALHAMLAQATAGMTEFMDANVLPTPDERMDEIDRLVDAEKAQAGLSAPPPRKRAAGA